jgi:hypothetical protein
VRLAAAAAAAAAIGSRAKVAGIFMWRGGRMVCVLLMAHENRHKGAENKSNANVHDTTPRTLTLGNKIRRILGLVDLRTR